MQHEAGVAGFGTEPSKATATYSVHHCLGLISLGSGSLHYSVAALEFH